MTEISVKDILKRPYHWVVFPDDGQYTAFVAEFPGCATCADTPEEALARLKDAADGWLHAVIHAGQDIPEPFDWDWVHKYRDSIK